MVLWGGYSALADHQLDHKETAFIKDAAQGGQAEVEMGKIAAEKAQNAELKKFAEHLQQDHSKANQELTQLAQTLGVTLPTEPSRKENKVADRLQDKTGADFDKAFAEHAIKDHEKDITKFQKALQDTKNPELKAFIEKSLPVLRHHLEMARNAGSTVGVDQKILSSADKFLSENRVGTGTTSRNVIDKTDAIGTAPGSQSGARTSSTPDSSTTK
jgi:putative membrane protein